MDRFFDELYSAFQTLDTEHSGLVSARTLQSCLHNLLSQNMSEDPKFYCSVIAFMESKAKANEYLNFEEFKKAIMLFNREEPSELFHLFDPSSTGVITKTSLEKVFDYIGNISILSVDFKMIVGEPYSNETIGRMIEYADSDGDGVVSKDEFCKMLCSG